MVRLYRVLLAATAAALTVALPAPASSQTFFESIFGSATPRPPAPVVRPQPQRGLLPAPVYSPYRPEREDTGPRQGGMVRTFCVRLCDGYYFPISFSTPRHKAGQDASECASRCTGETRLFVASSPNGEINAAHDLTGRAYTALPNAFLYRKRYISSCTCRPAPWSEAERNRHNRYAIAEGRQPEYASSDVRVLAGNGGDRLTPPEVIAGRPAVQPAPAAADEPNPTQADAVTVADAAAPSEALPTPRNTQPRKAAPAARTARKDVAKAPPAAVKRTKSASQTAAASWPLASQPKYSWPGDPPSRYR